MATAGVAMKIHIEEYPGREKERAAAKEKRNGITNVFFFLTPPHKKIKIKIKTIL